MGKAGAFQASVASSSLASRTTPLSVNGRPRASQAHSRGSIPLSGTIPVSARIPRQARVEEGETWVYTSLVQWQGARLQSAEVGVRVLRGVPVEWRYRDVKPPPVCRRKPTLWPATLPGECDGEARQVYTL
jgi:hypothetical protein